MLDIHHLRDIYRFPGFVARARVKPKPGDDSSLVITLVRRRKKRSVAAVAEPTSIITMSALDSSVTFLPATAKSTWKCRCVVSSAASVA